MALEVWNLDQYAKIEITNGFAKTVCEGCVFLIENTGECKIIQKDGTQNWKTIGCTELYHGGDRFYIYTKSLKTTLKKL